MKKTRYERFNKTYEPKENLNHAKRTQSIRQPTKKTINLESVTTAYVYSYDIMC